MITSEREAVGARRPLNSEVAVVEVPVLLLHSLSLMMGFIPNIYYDI